jgi:hypothetical protein
MRRPPAHRIPPFTPNGTLPPGIHWTTWQKFEKRFASDPARQWLLDGLRLALVVFRAAGCKTVYIDGSFVTNKLIPNDYDGCWESDDVDLDQLDPVFLLVEMGQPAQKAKYRGEFWLADAPTRAGVSHLRLFQRDRHTGQAKGIIAFDLATLELPPDP